MPSEYRKNGLKVIVSDLRITPTNMMNGRRRVYRVDAPFRILVRAEGVFDTLEVPTGFTTDLATIPLFAQVFIGGRDDPGVAEAAVAHDWMCMQNLPREYTNTRMWYLLLAMGVSRWRATAIYLALMLAGYKSPLSLAWKRVKHFCGMET